AAADRRRPRGDGGAGQPALAERPGRGAGGADHRPQRVPALRGVYGLMERRAEITVSSDLEASADAVWARAIDPAGINHELAPLMRITVTQGAENSGLDDPEPGHIGRSWVLLFGFIPFAYDDITVLRVEPGRGFLERSTMLSQRLWEHERTLE